LKKEYISCEEFDALSDNKARNYIYCMDCNQYHLHGFECPCGLPKQIDIICKDTPYEIYPNEN
jgi:hypothetical protein